MNSTANQTIPGFLLGCYSYESFSSSTLECLYDQACIQMLLDWRLFDYTNSYLTSNLTNISALNLALENEFSPNVPLEDIMRSLFVEEWESSANYTASFIQCQPSICTYSVIERYQLIYVVTSVIGLLGGLSVILRIFVPPSVKIVRLVYQHYYRRAVHSNESSKYESLDTPLIFLRFEVHITIGFKSDIFTFSLRIFVNPEAIQKTQEKSFLKAARCV